MLSFSKKTHPKNNLQKIISGLNNTCLQCLDISGNLINKTNRTQNIRTQVLSTIKNTKALFCLVSHQIYCLIRDMTH